MNIFRYAQPILIYFSTYQPETKSSGTGSTNEQKPYNKLEESDFTIQQLRSVTKEGVSPLKSLERYRRRSGVGLKCSILSLKILISLNFGHTTDSLHKK